MNQFFCVVLTQVRVGRAALQQTVRFFVVLALVLGFDIVFPDSHRSMKSSAAATYTVTFNSQGGPAVSSTDWVYGTSLTLPTPVRAGYTFNGWSDRPSGPTLVYQTTSSIRSGGSVVYTNGYGRGVSDVAANLTGQDAVYSRVKFRMETKYNGTLRYAEAAFDKWNQNLSIAELSVPDLASGNSRTVKTNVNNLTVTSDWPGVAGVASAVTNGSGKQGRLELWPWNYSPGVTGISPAGNATVYDSDDTAEGTNNYGSFQVHNLTDAQTVLAWNQHSAVNGVPDIGFGNYQVSNGGLVHSDWTFSQNTNFDRTSASWKLQIFIGDVLPGGTVFTPSNTAPFTLYAQWTANTSTVTYNYNNANGGNATASSTYTTGGTAITLPSPTRTGYDFAGWYADASFTTSVGAAGATYTPTSSGTLYAKWLTNQTGFAITNAPATLAYQSTVTIGTSGGNGTGAVVFATTSPSVCSVNANSGVVTMLASSGTCSLASTKAADNSYYATSATASITATKANQAALSITGGTSEVYGGTISLGTSGGSSAGSVTWSAGASSACSISSVGVVTVTAGSGSCSITASMAGDSNYNTVTSGAHSVSVSKANQTALTVTTTEVAYGRTLTLALTGGSGAGPVTWTKVSGTCSLNGVVVSDLGNVGSSCVVKATKAADTNYNSRSTSDTAIDVVKAAQTGFSITNSADFVTGSNLSLTATGGQSSSSVTWSLAPGSCTLSGSTLSATRGGITCIVTATRSGDTNYLATSDSQTVTVAKISQTLTFRSTAPSPASVGSTYTTSVDSNVFLAPSVVIANQSQSVSSINAGVVTFISTGTCIVSASQSGNDVYSSAAASQSITVVGATSNTTNSSSQSQSEVPLVSSTTSTQPANTTTTLASRLPSSRSGASTSSTSTTTTTTTTSVPANPGEPQMGKNGAAPELEAGSTAALVRGKVVNVSVKKVDEAIVLTLPNKVKVTIGRTQPGRKSVAVADDGVLRMYRQDIVDIEMAGLVPGTTFAIFMFSTPVELGRGVVSDDGSVSIAVSIPKTVDFGNHTVQVNGVGPNSEVVSMSMGIEILARESNTRVVLMAMFGAVLLALLSGRPILARRREKKAA